VKQDIKKKKATDTLNKKNERVFKIIAIALPFIFFILFELVLRLVGYGHDFSLFKKYPEDDRFLVLNDKIGLKYFSNQKDTRVGNYDIFLKDKTDNTYRVFILGASSSYGFPYELTTTFDRSIKYQLMHFFPDINFEIINLSITAVNSFTLLDFAKKLKDYEPDLILIYAGHNEYYGALGVGSTSKIGENRNLIHLVLKLRELRVTQLFRSFTLKKADANAKEDKSLMERMAAMQSIPYNSPAYYKGLKQYKANMNELCAIFSKLDIPVLYSTIISNEKDLAPLKSLDEPNELSADFQFQLATKALSDSNVALAREKFLLAKELDLLRFRAPQKINETIKELCAQYDNVYLVDSEEEIRSQIDNRILGKEVILEHVHPNLYGHRLISFAFINTLKSHQFISDRWPSTDEILNIRNRIPYTLVDSIRGEYITVMMKAGWPFNIPIPEDYTFGNSFEEKLADDVALLKLDWISLTNKLRAHYYDNQNYTELRKLLEVQATVLSYNSGINMDAGGVNVQMNDHERALFYFKKAFSLKPDSASAHSLAISYTKIDKPEQAIQYFEFLEQNINKTLGKGGIDLIQPIVKLKEELSKDKDNTSIMIKIAEHYLGFGYTENALQYIQMAQAIDKNNPECLDLITQINNKGK